jgi:hypothetical protein
MSASETPKRTTESSEATHEIVNVIDDHVWREMIRPVFEATNEPISRRL